MTRKGTIVPEVPRADNAEYMRLWRERRPTQHARAVARNGARLAAALKVAKAHPEEFARAIAREERKRGLR